MRNPIPVLAMLFTALMLGNSAAQDYSPGGGDRSARDERWPWPSERFGDNSRPRNEAGVFDYYALVLSWSPTYCATEGDDDAYQCNRRDGRRYSFVLHGLWPQYERGWPENCRLRRRAFVPQSTIDGMLDIMPSPGLVIHEYRKHGTCSGLEPDPYYALSRRLFRSVRVPSAFDNPFELQMMTPDDIVAAFVSANPNLRPRMLAVSCGGGANRLREVRICFTRDGQPRDCGANEKSGRLCNSQRVLVPPARSTVRDDGSGAPASKPDNGNSAPLPRPRVIEMLRGT